MITPLVHAGTRLSCWLCFQLEKKEDVDSALPIKGSLKIGLLAIVSNPCAQISLHINQYFRNLPQTFKAFLRVSTLGLSVIEEEEEEEEEGEEEEELRRSFDGPDRGRSTRLFGHSTAALGPLWIHYPASLVIHQNVEKKHPTYEAAVTEHRRKKTEVPADFYATDAMTTDDDWKEADYELPEGREIELPLEYILMRLKNLWAEGIPFMNGPVSSADKSVDNATFYHAKKRHFRYIWYGILYMLEATMVLPAVVTVLEQGFDEKQKILQHLDYESYIGQVIHIIYSPYI
ncbi:hypothetical protein C0J52_22888 [Blattella germanica]|nr:hypothetical protein C0J52_22888 [Blattella germanica]